MQYSDPGEGDRRGGLPDHSRPDRSTRSPKRNLIFASPPGAAGAAGDENDRDSPFREAASRSALRIASFAVLDNARKIRERHGVRKQKVAKVYARTASLLYLRYFIPDDKSHEE